MRWFWSAIGFMIVITGVLFAAQPTQSLGLSGEVTPIQVPPQIEEPETAVLIEDDHDHEEDAEDAAAAEHVEQHDDGQDAHGDSAAGQEAEQRAIPVESEPAEQTPATQTAADPVQTDGQPLAAQPELEAERAADLDAVGEQTAGDATTESAEAATESAAALERAPQSTDPATPADQPDPEPIDTKTSESGPIESNPIDPTPIDLGYTQRDDGTFEIGDAGIITGSGTDADPYVVNWPILISAEQDYQPRKGKTDLPGWTQLIEGKRVRLTGFLLLPVTSMEADELLVMQNTWDGCCIGVPPTPYDAVEVRLAQPMDVSGGLINYGTIEGTFRTDPYLVNNWLLGLFMLEDAQIKK